MTAVMIISIVLHSDLQFHGQLLEYIKQGARKSVLYLLLD